MEYIEEILAFYVLYLYVVSIYTQPVRMYVRTYTELLLLCLRCELRFVCFVFAGVLRASLARSLGASANSLTEEEVEDQERRKSGE